MHVRSGSMMVSTYDVYAFECATERGSGRMEAPVTEHSKNTVKQWKEGIWTKYPIGYRNQTDNGSSRA